MALVALKEGPSTPNNNEGVCVVRASVVSIITFKFVSEQTSAFPAFWRIVFWRFLRISLYTLHTRCSLSSISSLYYRLDGDKGTIRQMSNESQNVVSAQGSPVIIPLHNDYSSSDVPEWAMIELNGELIAPPSSAEAGKENPSAASTTGEDTFVKKEQVELGSVRFVDNVSVVFRRRTVFSPDGFVSENAHIPAFSVFDNFGTVLSLYELSETSHDFGNT